MTIEEVQNKLLSLGYTYTEYISSDFFGHESSYTVKVAAAKGLIDMFSGPTRTDTWQSVEKAFCQPEPVKRQWVFVRPDGVLDTYDDFTDYDSVVKRARRLFGDSTIVVKEDPVGLLKESY